jgi:hypothetical protein
MLREHKAVAMLLAVIAIGCAAYGWRAVHAHRAPRYPRAPTAAGAARGPEVPPGAANPAQPIYIVPIPDKDPP